MTQNEKKIKIYIKQIRYLKISKTYNKYKIYLEEYNPMKMFKKMMKILLKIFYLNRTMNKNFFKKSI